MFLVDFFFFLFFLFFFKFNARMGESISRSDRQDLSSFFFSVNCERIRNKKKKKTSFERFSNYEIEICNKQKQNSKTRSFFASPPHLHFECKVVFCFSFENKLNSILDSVFHVVPDDLRLNLVFCFVFFVVSSFVLFHFSQ